MILLYYFLSEDEERRMLKQYPDTYRAYMKRTGMFLPGLLEKIVMPERAIGKLALFALIVAVTIGEAFFLRDYTVRHLPI